MNALPLVLDYAPPHREGAYTGLFFLAMQLAEILGPILSGACFTCQATPGSSSISPQPHCCCRLLACWESVAEAWPSWRRPPEARSQGTRQVGHPPATLDRLHLHRYMGEGPGADRSLKRVWSRGWKE